jgi:hypothetical protein
MAHMQVPESFLYAEEAAADLSSSLYCMATVQEGTGKIRLANNTGEKPLGAIYEVNLATSAPFGPVTVQFAGIAKVKAGAAVAIGARLSVDSSGRAVTAGAAATFGIALSAAGAANEIISVALVG